MSSPEAIKHSMFLMALGSVTLSWSALEIYLDAITLIIHKNINGHTIEKDAPTSLKRRKEFIKKCLKNIPEISKYHFEIKELIGDVDRLKEKRHDLIHGAITSQNYEKNTLIGLARIVNSKVEIKEYSYTTKDIEALSDEISDVAKSHFDWVIRFIKEFSKPL